MSSEDGLESKTIEGKEFSIQDAGDSIYMDMEITKCIRVVSPEKHNDRTNRRYMGAYASIFGEMHEIRNLLTKLWRLRICRIYS